MCSTMTEKGRVQLRRSANESCYCEGSRLENVLTLLLSRCATRWEQVELEAGSLVRRKVLAVELESQMVVLVWILMDGALR